MSKSRYHFSLLSGEAGRGRVWNDFFERPELISPEAVLTLLPRGSEGYHAAQMRGLISDLDWLSPGLGWDYAEKIVRERMLPMARRLSADDPGLLRILMFPEDVMFRTYHERLRYLRNPGMSSQLFDRMEGMLRTRCPGLAKNMAVAEALFYLSRRMVFSVVSRASHALLVEYVHGGPHQGSCASRVDSAASVEADVLSGVLCRRAWSAVADSK